MLNLLAVAILTHQSEFAPGDHLIAARADSPAVVFSGSNRTLDLSKYRLAGTRSRAQERYHGVGILFDHCSDLVIRGLNVRGYRINVLLNECKNVRLENVVADRSHADRIITPEGQPIDSFLNLRDVGAWSPYGAGIWLHNCARCRLNYCHATDAMNGAVLENCDHCSVYDCDLSFNSAWGLALWNSSNNRILWNHIDFCNRPWAGGWGGDAADMVVVNNSNQNLIVGNSMTHGGDGFFLADKSMGGWDAAAKKFHYQGGCNDNQVWNNDGSWSPNNAFESTFSRDYFGQNWADDSGYGFWLGYSYDSLIAGNQIERDFHDGVAIEHGQQNRIVANHFADIKEVAVHLWSTPDAKDLEKPSQNNLIAFNRIDNAGQGLNLTGSHQFTLSRNAVSNAPFTVPTVSLNEAGSDLQPEWSVPPEVKAVLGARPAGWKLYRETDYPKGLEWIQAGAYAPVHWRGQGVAHINANSYKLWIQSAPDTLRGPDWLILATGSDKRYWTATTSGSDDIGTDREAQIGWAAAPGGSMTLTFRTGVWHCKWFPWKNLSYADRNSWLYLFDSAPAATQELSDLDADYSYKSPVPGVLPTDHFALLATRTFQFQQGVYMFATTSDDGIRLFVDGREVISRWTHHAATEDQVEVPLVAGPHDLRVEYCQEDGAAVLKVDWKKIATPVRRPVDRGVTD